MHYNKYPAIPPAVGMACGILFASAGSVGVLATAGVCAFATLFFAPRTHRAGIVVFFAFLVLGGLVAFIAAPPRASGDIFDGRFHTFRGEIVREQTFDGRQRLIMTTDSGAPLRLSLSLSDMPVTYEEGDIIRVNARAELPGKSAAIPFNDDYHRPDRVSAVLYARPDDVTLLQPGGALARVRGDWLHAIYNSGLSVQSAELLASAWLGTHDAGPDVREQFRAAGLSHLLCVSGFHLGLLSGVVLGMLVWLNLVPYLRLLRYFISIAVAWGFAFLVGFQPPVIRAAVMLSVYFLARITERGSQPLNSLAVAVIVILLINPYWIYSVGFQLSAAAVAGIILMAKRLNPVPMRKSVMPLHRLAALFVLPLSAMIATAPVVLWHFHTLPLLSIPVNALAALLFPCFMTLGALSVFLSSFGLCPVFLLRIVDFLCDAVCRMCDSVSTLPFSSLRDVYLTPASMLLLVGAVLMLLLALHSAKRLRLSAAVGSAICLLLVGCDGGAPRREMIVYNNMYSTVLAFRVNDAGVVISPGGYIPLALDRYFKGHGVVPEIAEADFTLPELAQRGNIFLAGKDVIVLADKKTAWLPPLRADLVILTRDTPISTDTLSVPFVRADEIIVREF